MFTFVALLAFVAPFLVRADVSPTEPAPGDIFNEGSPCTITWGGDTNSTTNWKNMAIQLMAGSNLAMEPMTTVATNQDGTVSGTFTFTCPAVTPNSAIYFYQFTAPATSGIAWTGRFTIASANGQSTPPANSNQPGTNQPIPWGNASLADPSTAIPPPSFDSAPSNSSSSTLNSTSLAPTVTSSSTGAATTGTITVTPVVTSSSSLPSSTTSATGQSTSDASGTMIGFDVRVLGAVAAATLALSFAW